MNRIIISFFALMLTMAAMAQNPYAKYYTDLPCPLEQVEPVVFPDNRVSITDFGAVGDGKTLCSEAIAKAMDALTAKGGGHLDFPAGKWLTGPVEMKSNIDLHLAEGATLLFSPDKTLYVYSDSKGKPSKKCRAMIYGSKIENIGITGKGTIDGQGEYWRPLKKAKVGDDIWQQRLALGGVVQSNIWYPFNLKPELGIPNIASTAKAQENMRHYLINILDSKNMIVEGVSIVNSPKFHLVPSRITNLIIDGVTIWCPGYAQNGDAMDIGNCNRVLIRDCKINCGDDGLCMKGGAGEKALTYGPNQNLLIEDCLVNEAHGGFVIGSEFSGGMKNIVVRRCKFDGTDIGLRFKSAPGRGGTCENIYCYDIEMDNILKEAILFETTYEDGAVGTASTDKDDKSAFFPDFCNFTISDVTAKAKNAFTINGLVGHAVHDIKLKNVRITATNGGLNFSNAENITMEGVEISSKYPNMVNKTTCKAVTLNGKKLVK